jgi:two-component system phosphate regulon sensor histidine kinase PhoR
MLSRIRWRVIIPFVLINSAAVATMLFFFARPACISDPLCVRRVAILVGLGTITLAIIAAIVVAERTARPIRNLTHVTRRIAEGDASARILPRTRDETGELTRAFNHMVERMREQVETLSEEHQQFAAVLHNTADGVLITDNLGYVTLINPAANRLLQTTEMEALGRSFAAVVRHYQLIELWQRCREEGSEQVEAVEFGPDLFLQAVVTPFQQEGSPGYLVILQDLTQMRRLQTVRRDFISNLSHELRTPLASLRAVIETLQDSALADPPAATHFLEHAQREVDTMTQMVEELLELSQIESGQASLQLGPTAVADLVMIPLERLRQQAERNNLRLALELPVELPHVLADVGRMHQVVTNLLHNAIKFTLPGGEVRITAAVDDLENPGEVIVEIHDTGVGIPRRDLPRIFERFYKSDRARTRNLGGTGLGLAIARHIVQAHGGRIWAKSKEGKGSTFYFSLPVASPTGAQR